MNLLKISILILLSFNILSFEITYKTYIPKVVKKNPKLMVMLHGCTQNAKDFLNQTHIKTYADKYGFIVLAPQKNNILSNPLKCWSWYTATNKKRHSSKSEKAKILKKIKKLQKKYNVSKTYVAGFSAGGVMSSIMASCHSDIFSGALIAAGIAYKGLYSKTIKLPKPIEIKNQIIPTDLDFSDGMSTTQLYSHLNRDEISTVRKLQKKSKECYDGKNSKLKNILIFQGYGDPITRRSHISKLFSQHLTLDGNFISYEYNKGSNSHFEYYGFKNSSLRVDAYQIFNLKHAWSGGHKKYRFSNEKTIDSTKIMIELFKLNE